MAITQSSFSTMRNFMELVVPKVTTDDEGFGEAEYEVVARFRAAKVDRRDWRTNEQWINDASFSTERTQIMFRSIPGITVTTGHSLMFNGNRYRIVAVDTESGRGMYVYVLAEKQVPSAR